MLVASCTRSCGRPQQKIKIKKKLSVLKSELLLKNVKQNTHLHLENLDGGTSARFQTERLPCAEDTRCL